MKDMMNNSEKKILLDFLEELSDRFGNDGCNDYELDNSSENRELCYAAMEYGVSKGEADEWLENLNLSKKIIFSNFIILDYLIQKFKND